MPASKDKSMHRHTEPEFFYVSAQESIPGLKRLQIRAHKEGLGERVRCLSWQESRGITQDYNYGPPL